MKDQEFSPRKSLERAFQRWWVIVLLTALGGIIGWAIHFLQPPVYEATAVITVNMDFQKVKLTQGEEDYAFNAGGAIGESSEVENQIVTEARADGFPIDINHLTAQMFLERRQSVWEFHIRNRDPKTAAKLANKWAEKALYALNAALGSAIRADQIQAQIDNINRNPATAGSPALSSETQATLNNLSDELLQEKQLSQGVISIMKFSLTGSATVPQKPALYNLADLVLAGGCIGFVISMWVASSYKVMSRGG
ncbi:MAG: Wzz/FepE/Etk N-terminal domain-containing protein [Anaerolineales bacterium]